MRLVPRQLRRKDFRGSVPYHGGRLTPPVIAGIGKQPATPDEVRAQLMAAVQTLLAHSMLTQQEHEDILRRIDELGQHRAAT
jgi:hypothetical protein